MAAETPMVLHGESVPITIAKRLPIEPPGTAGKLAAATSLIKSAHHTAGNMPQPELPGVLRKQCAVKRGGPCRRPMRWYSAAQSSQVSAVRGISSIQREPHDMDEYAPTERSCRPAQHSA